MSFPPMDGDGGDPYWAYKTFFGATQRPFRFGDGPDHVPPWLARLMDATTDEETRAAYPELWLLLVATVANEDPEGGSFHPEWESWRAVAGLTRADSWLVAMTFCLAGGLRERGGRLRVRRWAEDYRCSPFLADLWSL